MPKTLAPAGCLIGDRSIIPDGPYLPVVDPFTEQPMGSVAESGSAELELAVATARAASEVWAHTPVEQRARLLDAVADVMEADGAPLAALVTCEMGMPITLATATQVDLPATVLRASAAAAREFAWREDVSGATLLRYGAGVVGAITPWNMPVHQIIAKLSAAVAAGAAVVLKPSEQTPYDALRVAGYFLQAGAPAGLINVVNGTGPAIGAALAGHPALARLSFTGSVRAGAEVARLAAGSLTRCALELGGKSPAVLLPDADFARAVPAAIASGLVNSGQACNATTRMVVPAERAEEVEELAAAAAAGYRLGDPTDRETQQGPLVSLRQRDAVLERIAGAVRDGGRLLTGTGRPSTVVEQGYFVDPTVVAGLPANAPAVQEEIFGPVVVIQTYRDVDDAVRLANGTAYGLSAEVYSADPAGAAAVAARLRVGQVKINGVRTRTRPAVPFGGNGKSGYGRELGPLGIEEFTELTAVMA